MTDKQKREKEKWTYLIELEKLMDSLDLNPTGVMSVQTMMVVRDFLRDLTEEQREQLLSSNPMDLVRIAAYKGLDSDLVPVPKSEAVNRVDHNGQYRSYKTFEKHLAELDEPER